MTMQSELVFTDPMLNVVIAEVKRFNCPLLFVKDHGVYVMAAKGEKTVMGCTMSVTPMVLIRIQRILTSSGTGCVMPGGDDFCESRSSIRGRLNFSRTKPCLKIMLSETELEVIAGDRIDHKSPLNRAFYISLYLHLGQNVLLYIVAGHGAQVP